MTEASQPFNAHMEVSNGLVSIVVTGDVDAFTAPKITAVADETLRLIERTLGESEVLVDLSEVTLIDSAGINALLAISKRFDRFAILAPHAWQRRLFEIVGLLALLADGDAPPTSMA